MRKTVLLLLLLLAACDSREDSVQGYVEGDFVRVGLPAAGRVTALSVERGDKVVAGQDLFALDATAEVAAVNEAKARIAQAEHLRDDLLTGKRALEIKALKESQAQAEAALKLSVAELRRREVLVKLDYASREALDEARSNAERDRARVAELSSQVAFAREGGRSEAIAAAEASVQIEKASLAQAEWALSQRSAKAPSDGVIDDVLFRPGEMVATGQPVVSLLPPANIKLRFYLSPQAIARVTPGSKLAVVCAGCAPGLGAKVVRIASEASYAPPVLYSRDAQAKLVFLVEARPVAEAESFHPGQPVTLTLPPAGATP